MMRCFVILIMTWVPALANAQPVVIRSGEHDGYTRLVFDFPMRVPWSVENTDPGAKLSFPESDFRFDPSAVFSRISRGRLQDLQAEPDGRTITLDFACDCEVTGFWHADAMLVLDIRGVENSRRETVDTTEQSPQPANDGGRPALPTNTTSTLAGLSSSVLERPDPAVTPSETALPGSLNSTNIFELSRARDELLKQFGRAASQGLLTPRVAIPQAATDTAMPPPPVTGLEGKLDIPMGPPAPQSLQLRARSSMDSAFMDVMNERMMAMSQSRTCLDPALTDVATWATDASFWQQVSKKRTALTGEFDRMNKEAVISLAQLYIHFGFGHEARQVLNAASSDSLKHRVLIAMSDIMDHETAGHASPLHGQFDCDGRTALWAILAQANPPFDARFDPDEIVTAFAALPRHLRAHLGPILSKRLLDAGFTGASEKILRILNRTKDTVTSRSELVSAETDRAVGQNDRADEKLRKISESNSESAVTALIEMIESLVQREKPVSYDMAQLAGAYAFEQRKTADAPALRRAHVLALAASGAFDEAYTVLETFAMEEAATMRPALADILTRQAPEMVFLKHVLADRTGLVANLEQAVVINMASRLFEAGFVDAAANILAGPVPNEARETRLLRAEISLAQGLPRRAEVDLLGLDGPDVNILRARARSMAGEHDQARDLYMSAGLTEDADREAWLAETADATFRPQPESDPGPVLARNRDLLEASNATRAELRALLSANPAPTLDN